jgi:hypothetical protein
MDSVLRLHAEIDREAARLEAVHRERLACRRGCHACCVDDLSVFEIEAERIRRNHAELLRSGAPHPEGACAFLDAGGACRIYEDRPYVCRTQGLPLRWLETDEAGTTLELRDICPLNDTGSPIEALAVGSCWTIGPYEGRLAALQGDERRVRLRELFSS